MSSWILESTAVPEINDLVQVTFDRMENPQPDPLTPELASRVEDVLTDPVTGRITEYVIASPFFASASEMPDVTTTLFLRWLMPRGVGMLPVAFVGLESTNRGLRQWRLAVSGPPFREQRRRFVRVAISLPTALRVQSDLRQLDLDQQRLPETAGVDDTLPVLPDVIQARVIDVSEGGMLCTSTGQVLPDHLPVTCTFTLDAHQFQVEARVVRSVGERSRSQTRIRTALSFEVGGKQADLLRALVFQEQRRAARQLSA